MLKSRKRVPPFSCARPRCLRWWMPLQGETCNSIPPRYRPYWAPCDRQQRLITTERLHESAGKPALLQVQVSFPQHDEVRDERAHTGSYSEYVREGSYFAAVKSARERRTGRHRPLTSSITCLVRAYPCPYYLLRTQSSFASLQRLGSELLTNPPTRAIQGQGRSHTRGRVDAKAFVFPL